MFVDFLCISLYECMGLYTGWAYTRVSLVVFVRWAYTQGGLIHGSGWSSVQNLKDQAKHGNGT